MNHLYSREFVEEMHRAQQRLGELEVDHTRVKPVVKIVGEFWAQLTEGDGNFNMFAFLEREGAQVHIESISGWIDYLLYQSRKGMEARKGLDYRYNDARWWELGRIAANRWGYRRKWLLLRAARGHGSISTREPPNTWVGLRLRWSGSANWRASPIPSIIRWRAAAKDTLKWARTSTTHQQALSHGAGAEAFWLHAVFAIRRRAIGGGEPLPGDDFSAHRNRRRRRDQRLQRVQMALGEARARARTEFEVALGSTGHSLDAIREFAGAHRRLRSPFYPFPRRPGVAGAAANFVMHAGRLMDGRERMARLPGER